MSVELLLIRHAQPVAVAHDPAGANPGLTDIGVTRADALAKYLTTSPFGPIRRVVSSTMRRAVDTAEPIGAALGLPIDRDPRIVELDSGWTNYGAAIGSYPSRRAGWQDLNTGRFGSNTFDLNTFRDRIREGLDEIAAETPDGTAAAVICHGGVISAYLAQVLGTAQTFFVDTTYTSVTRVLAEADGYRELLSVNETPHLVR